MLLFKQLRWFQQILEPHLEENSCGVSGSSQLEVGWVHPVAPMERSAEPPTPKITFITITDLEKNPKR